MPRILVLLEKTCMSASNNLFPKFLVSVGGMREFVTLIEAGRRMNYGYSKVELHPEVLESDFSVRVITDAERNEIQRIADAASASK